MLQIPGWITGLIVLALVIALGWAAILPREINVQVNNEVENTANTVYSAPVTYHYNNHHTEELPEEADPDNASGSDGN